MNKTLSRKVTCSICGKKVNRNCAHDAYPVRDESWYHENKNRCCTECNYQFVVPIRIVLGRDGGGYHQTFKKMNYSQLLQFTQGQAV